MRQLLVVVAVLGWACGGGARRTAGDEASPPPGAEVAPPSAAAGVPAPPSAGTVHVVRMLTTPDGRFVYQPDVLYVRVGDRVRWVNVSGGPHNVAFYRNAVPAGAADFLNAMMVDRMSDLTGALLFEPDAAYEISFVGAPAGSYAYFCTPHELLDMKAELVVSR